MGENLASLLTATSIVLASWGFGRAIVRVLRLDRDGGLEMLAWSLGLGTAAATALLWILGSIRLTHPELVATITLLAAAWGLAEGLYALASLRTPLVLELNAAVSNPEAAGACRYRAAGLALAGVSAAATLLVALAPPARIAIAESLEPAKQLVLDHGFQWNQTDHPNSGLGVPGLVRVWFAWGLALDGPVAAALLAWTTGLAMALATIVLAQTFVGRSHAIVAGGLVLLAPGVQLHMAVPLADLSATAVGTLALAAWCRWTIEAAGSRWLAIAAVLSAAAVCTGGAAAPLVLAMLAATMLHNPRPDVASLHAWHAKVLIAWSAAAAGLYALARARSGTGEATTAQVLEALKYLGPLFLATFPVLVVCRRLRGLGVLVGIATATAALGSCHGGGVWCLTLVPPLAIVAVWVWQELDRLTPRCQVSARVLLGIVLVSMTCVSLARVGDVLAVAAGFESREQYLLRACPDYPITLLASHFLEDGAHLLSDHMPGGYLECRVTSDPQLSLEAARASEAAPVAARLRGAGITHVLLADKRPPSAGGSKHPAARPPWTNIPLGTDRRGQCYRLLILR